MYGKKTDFLDDAWLFEQAMKMVKGQGGKVGLRKARFPNVLENLRKKYPQKKTALKKRAGKSSSIRRGLVRQEGSSSSKSLVNFGSNPGVKGRAYKLSAPQYFVRNEAGVNVQSTAGAQSAYQIPYTHYSVLKAVLNTSPNTPSAAARYLMESVSAEHLLANAASFGASLTIYDVVCRRDTPIAGYDPVNCFINGLSDEGGSGSSYTTVGATPFQSEQFNQFFKVVQTTKVDVPSGGTHRHIISFKPNKMLHGEVINSLVANSAGSLADFGIFTLFVFHGQPAHDSTTVSSVTLSPASFDIITKLDYRYRYSQESAADWTRSNNLATTFAVGAQFVNDLVGQVQDASGLHPSTLIS